MAFVKQKLKTDCGVACLAMLCDVKYDTAMLAIDWYRRGYYGTQTRQLRDAAEILGYRTEGTPTGRLKLIRVPKELLGKKVDYRIWTYIPDNSLTKIPAPIRGDWHWVVWRKNKVYDPAVGVFGPKAYHRVHGNELNFPSSYMQFIKE